MSISKKLRKPLLFLLLAVLTAALIKSFFIPASTAVKSSDTVLELDTIWDRAVQGSAVTFTCTIPEDARAGSVLLVNNNSIPFRLLLDGTEFYSYEDPCGERGMALQKIELPENPAGKALVFETKPLSVSSASLFHAFLGNENGIFLHVLFQNLPSIIFSAISAVLGAAVFLVYLVFSGKQVHGSELQTLPPLGAFLLMAGIWVFTDSGAVHLYRKNRPLRASVLFFLYAHAVLSAGFYPKNAFGRPPRSADIILAVPGIRRNLWFALYFSHLPAVQYSTSVSSAHTDKHYSDSPVWNTGNPDIRKYSHETHHPGTCLSLSVQRCCSGNFLCKLFSPVFSVLRHRAVDLRHSPDRLCSRQFLRTHAQKCGGENLSETCVYRCYDPHVEPRSVPEAPGRSRFLQERLHYDRYQ